MEEVFMYIHLILASELVPDICSKVLLAAESEDCLKYVSHREEAYHKDSSMTDISFDMEVIKPLTEKEWIILFDKYIPHNDIHKDDKFLEICHYSAAGDRYDPFVIVFVPVTQVKV